MSAKLKVVLADLFYVNRLTQNRLCVPLNVGYVAAYTKSLFGDQVEISIFKDVKLLLDHLTHERPDVVGFSFYYWNQNLNYAVVKRIREAWGDGVLTVFGGPSVDSIEPEHRKLLATFPDVDVFVEGEGEAGFASLMSRVLADRASVFDAPIDCSFFDRGGKYLRGMNTSKNLDLSRVPSPYLNGYLDQFLARSYFPLLQATRTCPYLCTFCVSGKDRSKLRGFPLDQVKQEIDYIAHWNRERPHVLLNLAELNFGINEQDPEIAAYLRTVSERTGYPASVYFYSDKRFTENSRRVIEALGHINKDGLVFSLQSDHPDTLKAINRKNLPDSNIQAGIAWAKERRIPVTTEVIFGLPYETYDSMVTLLNKSVSQGFDSIMLHNLFIMEGIELNRDSEVARHGIKSKLRLLGSNYMMLDDELVFEFERIVTENNYFSFDDFVKIRSLNLMFFSVFQGGFYKPFFQYVRSLGIPLATFFSRFMNPDPGVPWPDGYLRFVQDFRTNAITELHESLDDLGETVKRLWDVNKDVGEPVRLNPYYFSRLMYRESAWVNDVLRQTLASMTPEGTFQSRDVEALLHLCQRLIIDLRKLTTHGGTVRVGYDVAAWRDDKFAGTLDRFAATDLAFDLEMSPAQQNKLESFARVNGHLEDKDYHFVAAESIFPRSSLFYDLKPAAPATRGLREVHALPMA